jgi:hypothetical protein
MSKKKLLEESTIRSFMKLANLQPLTNKFLKESEQLEEEELEESSHEGRKLEEETLEEETLEEEGEVTEEAKTLAPQKPGKMDAAKHTAPDAKMTPLKAGTHHSDKPDSIETKGHSNAPKKNNSEFEVVSENLEQEEMEMEADDMTGSDAAGESEEHQETVKDAIQKILGAVSQIAQEYGVEMDVQSGEEEEMEPEAPPADMAPEAPEAEDEKMMEAKLEEMVEKLTKRVAARLVKESKKKR